ncbi:MAG: 5'/3'-nucleotidase SurE [Muribaculaceae bacterium]|nr:5'/3'-nucleotidase SurE [Muribaculaceae bacterium]
MILVSNDDGYLANGVRELMKFLAPYDEVVAICPDSPRSGQSMALTFTQALRVREVESPVEGARLFKTNGTPVDCIKLARYAVLGDRNPSLVVSGINHGSNSAINVIYSGTMGAVFEGCALGVPSIGFSLTSHRDDADFSGCRRFVDMLVPSLLEHGLPDGVCLNVNIPDCHPIPTRIALTRQARGAWTEEYEKYIDPQGEPFYMVTGRFDNYEPDARDTDEWCLAHGIASLTPQLLDRTAPEASLPEWLKHEVSVQI